MPVTQSSGYHIDYQVHGEGTPLVLHHGFTSNQSIWSYYGYVQALSQHYKVITIDALGHGKSDKPHTSSAYTLEHRCGDVLAVLDALHIQQAHYVGYSLGGRVGYGLMRYAPERITSLILGGAHPYADLSTQAFAHVDGENPEAFFKAMETVVQEQIPAAIKMQIRHNDLVALAASSQYPRLSLASYLQDNPVPTLLFCGKDDQRHSSIEEFAAALPNSEFISIPHATHISCLSKADNIIPCMEVFLQNQHH